MDKRLETKSQRESAEVARLRAALKPFAKVRISKDRQDDSVVWFNLTVGDFRAAAKAMSGCLSNDKRYGHDDHTLRGTQCS